MDSFALEHTEFTKVRAAFVKMVNVGQDARVGMTRRSADVEDLLERITIFRKPPYFDLRYTLFGFPSSSNAR